MNILNQVYGAIKQSNIRHELLSQNVARASDPGYKSKDLATHQSGFASTLAVSMTNQMHLSGTKKRQEFKVKEDRNPKHLKANGNDVHLPEQMFKISNNQMNQQKLLKIYSFLEDMMRTSIGK